MGEGGREIIDWLVECISSDKVSECSRKVVGRLIEVMSSGKVG